jgi:cell division protein FtsL
MTVARHAATAAGRAPAASPPARLALVPETATRPHRTPFVLLVVAVLGVGLVGLLLLNTTLAQGSFRMHDLQRQTAALQDQEQQLQIAVDDAATPQRLARAARKLGLVPAPDPGFLRLSDGKILGQPSAAAAPVVHASARPSPAPSTAPSTGPPPSATGAAKATSKPTANPRTQPSPKPSRPHGGRR